MVVLLLRPASTSFACDLLRELTPDATADIMLSLLSIAAHGLSLTPTRASAPKRAAARMLQAAPPAGFEWGLTL